MKSPSPPKYPDRSAIVTTMGMVTGNSVNWFNSVHHLRMCTCSTLTNTDAWSGHQAPPLASFSHSIISPYGELKFEGNVYFLASSKWLLEVASSHHEILDLPLFLQA